MPTEEVERLRKRARENIAEADRAMRHAMAWQDKAHKTWLLLQQAKRDLASEGVMLDTMRVELSHVEALKEMLMTVSPPEEPF